MGRPGRGPHTKIITRHVAHRMRERRRSLGLTIVKVAESLGISYQLLHKYETGITHVPASRLYDLALVLDVEIDYFFHGLSDEQVLPGAGAEMGFLLLAVTFIRLGAEDQAILIQVARLFAGRRARPTPQPALS